MVDKKKFNTVIYKNHILRAKYMAMYDICVSILKNLNYFEADKELPKIDKILRLIPEKI